MDKRAAGQYLDTIFGSAVGYVAVAYKDKDQSWQESQFLWPKDKAKLIGWAEVHKDANVFVCPALRKDGHTRKKGDGTALRWLWADVDWQSVPADRVDDVAKRINELGSVVVKSGSGDNSHVYVELNQEVSPSEFIKLNTGLRDYLYADNKQADNSLLRLPGTVNWKTDAGSPVVWSNEKRRRGTGKDPALLMKKHVFRDARVIEDVEATEWEFTEVEGLPRRIQAMVTMDVAQAEARYGNRFKAVWAVTGDLHKRGLGADEIHSLMDKFPPAVSKAADENGYDVHRDVDKRLAYDRSKNVVVEDDEEAAEDAGDIFEEMTAEEVMESLVAEGVEKELMRRTIRRAADMAESERTWVEPPPTVSQSLTDALVHPPEAEPFLIAGLAPIRGNIVLTAQFKSGKTDLVVGSLARSLCDGVPFLDKFDVTTPAGGMRVGHWNLEMDHAFLVDQYIRPSGYVNTDNLVIASLRGYRISLTSEVGRKWAVNWLKDNQIKVWTIDSIAQLARMCGISENSNEEMAQMFGAIDEIKTEAGVETCFLIAHTGRAEQEVGKERARAATVIDDWPDFRWVMTVDNSEIRYLQVQGRGEGLKPTSLDYDPTTHRYTLGGMSRAGAASDGWVQEVMRIVEAHGEAGITESSLWTKMKEIRPIGKPLAIQHMVEADDGGFIVRKRAEANVGRGGRKAWMHYPIAKPDAGDRTRRATPRDVNLTAVNLRSNGPNGPGRKTLLR